MCVAYYDAITKLIAGRTTRGGKAPEATVVAVKVTASKLDVNAVPPAWGVPRDFGGRLTLDSRHPKRLPRRRLDLALDLAGCPAEGPSLPFHFASLALSHSRRRLPLAVLQVKTSVSTTKP